MDNLWTLSARKTVTLKSRADGMACVHPDICVYQDLDVRVSMNPKVQFLWSLGAHVVLAGYDWSTELNGSFKMNFGVSVIQARMHKKTVVVMI